MNTSRSSSTDCFRSMNYIITLLLHVCVCNLLCSCPPIFFIGDHCLIYVPFHIIFSVIQSQSQMLCLAYLQVNKQPFPLSRCITVFLQLITKTYCTGLPLLVVRFNYRYLRRVWSLKLAGRAEKAKVISYIVLQTWHERERSICI